MGASAPWPRDADRRAKRNWGGGGVASTALCGRGATGTLVSPGRCLLICKHSFGRVSHSKLCNEIANPNSIRLVGCRGRGVNTGGSVVNVMCLRKRKKLYLQMTWLYIHIYVHLNKSTRTGQRISKAAEHKTNTQKSTASLHVNNEQSKKKVKGKIQFTVAYKRIKYPGTNPTQGAKDMFIENVTCLRPKGRFTAVRGGWDYGLAFREPSGEFRDAAPGDVGVMWRVAWETERRQAR